MGRRLITLRLLAGEQGQAMVITAAAMFAALMMSAFTIDAANWYQKHHQTQLAADAASLAAANCLANAGAGRTCTSTTDTTDAAAVAQTIAAANGIAIIPSQVHVSAGKVTINAASNAPSLFAEAGGVAAANLNASASAGYSAAMTTYTTITQETPTTTTSTSTTPVTGSPLALFAMDSSCADEGVNQQGGSDTFDGGVFSNSSLFLDPGGSTYESLNYGTGSSCGATTEGGGGDYTDGAATKALGDLTSWPVPYNTSADPLPACTDTYSGSGTWDIGNVASETTPVVYCYPNGTILLTGYESYDDDSFICGSISIQGGGIGLEAEDYPANKLLIYATGTGDAANLTNGGGVIKGDVEAPNGTIGFNSGSNSFTGLLEGQDVLYDGGSETITGDGPTTYGVVTTSTTTTVTNPTTTTVPVTTTGATDDLVQ